MNVVKKFPFQKTFDILQIDDATHSVYGRATSEMPDRDGEIFDYNYGKQAFIKWSNETLKQTTTAGMEPSLGNMRIMHSLEVGGKITRLDFKDDLKEIWIDTQPVDDSVWKKIKGGFLRAFSIGGSYVWRKEESVAGKTYTRYAADISEVSYVDNPCNPEAVITIVKADGSKEQLKPEQVRLEDLVANAQTVATQFVDAIKAMSTRVSNGQFTVQAQGEAHDFLTNSGYNHTRTGSSNANDGLPAQPIYVYNKDNESVSIYNDGTWEHDDGHARRTNGVSLGSLKNHIEVCSASVGTDMLKTELENLAKALPFRFTTEQLSAIIKGEQPVYTVGEQMRLERIIKLDAEAEAEELLEEELEADEDAEALEKLLDLATEHGMDASKGLTVAQVLELEKYNENHDEKGQFAAAASESATSSSAIANRMESGSAKPENKARAHDDAAHAHITAALAHAEAGNRSKASEHQRNGDYHRQQSERLRNDAYYDKK